MNTLYLMWTDPAKELFLGLTLLSPFIHSTVIGTWGNSLAYHQTPDKIHPSFLTHLFPWTQLVSPLHLWSSFLRQVCQILCQLQDANIAASRNIKFSTKTKNRIALWYNEGWTQCNEDTDIFLEKFTSFMEIAVFQQELKTGRRLTR
jgi:hypothetical protein